MLEVSMLKASYNIPYAYVNHVINLVAIKFFKNFEVINILVNSDGKSRQTAYILIFLNKNIALSFFF